MVHGRDRERDQLAELIAAAREGRSFAVLVEGLAGIGKSTLLDEAAAAADGTMVLRTQGYQAEADIPFAGLVELLAPLLHLRERLPDGPAHALGVALALEEPAAHDRFAVPVAVLGLLGLAAEERPVIVVVDDAHWLDEASLEAILFAAHRLDAEGIGVILAARDADGRPVDRAGLTVLELGPLDDAAALAVLAEDEALAASVATEIAAISAGNPLALRELPRSLTAQQRQGYVAIPAPLWSGHGVQAAFERELAALPDASQRALCLASALAAGEEASFDAAAAQLGLDRDALDPALDAGAVRREDGRIAFRHPLLRAAAYHARPSGDRRAAHAAIAATTPDRLRSAWHRASAATGPDEEVAAALDAAADDARRRGAHGEAARASTRASELSPQAQAGARRALVAARDFAVAGHGERALELTRAAAGDEATRGEAELVRAHVLLRGGQSAQALELLEALAAAAARAGDRVGAARMLVEASLAHMLSGDLPRLLSTAERAQAKAAGHAPELELLAVLICGEALVALGRSADGEALLRAAEPLLHGADPLSEVAEVIGMGALSLVWLERFDRAEAVLGRLVDAGRAAGAAGRLGHPLSVRATLHWRRGRWAAAYADAAEAVALARDTQQLGTLSVALPPLVRCEAALGRLDEARAHGREALALADAAGVEATAMHALAALGFLELTVGRPDEALAWLARADRIGREQGHGEPSMGFFAADHVEALARAGELEAARAALDVLVGQAQATGGGWANAAAERCRLLLADDDEVETHAARALAWHEPVDLPFERARTELALGQRLRRARRRADARTPLAAALSAFERLGAEPWAAVARAELRATGVASAQPTPAPVEELTPHELQVALLVGQGMTNREAGAALFVSPKTIEHHLSAIYRKLGLRSRTQLAALLSEDGERAAA